MELSVMFRTTPSLVGHGFVSENVSPLRGYALSPEKLTAMAHMLEGAAGANVSWSPGHFDASRDAQALERFLANEPAARTLVEQALGGGLSFAGAIDGRINVLNRSKLATPDSLLASSLTSSHGAAGATPVLDGVRATPAGVGAAYVRPAQVAHAAALAAAPVTATPANSVVEAMRACSTSDASAPSDYAFLDDPALSTREKVMMFIGRQLSSIEGDMQRIMRQKSGGSSASSNSSATGTSSNGGANVGDMIGSALSTAATMFLGPIGGLVSGVVQGISSLVSGGAGGAPSSGPAGASGRSNGSSQAPSEGETNMQLQNLVNRQQQMMTMASNVLSSLHQTAMTPLNNLRG